MLNPKYFIKGIKKMCTLYNKDKNEEECMLYYEYFKNYTNEQFKFTVEECIKKYTWFPSVAQMLGVLDDLKPNPDEGARDFESKLFSLDTDSLIRYYEKEGDVIAVTILKNNYEDLRNCNLGDTKIMKAQLREQYKAISNKELKKQKIANNNLQNLLGEIKENKMIGANNENGKK